MQELRLSDFTIALSNTKVGLKPKGKVVYEWCRYYPETLVHQDMSLEVNLKYGDRDISESSLVFPRSKDEEAGGKPLLSQSATNIMYLKQLNNSKGKVLASCR